MMYPTRKLCLPLQLCFFVLLTSSFSPAVVRADTVKLRGSNTSPSDESGPLSSPRESIPSPSIITNRNPAPVPVVVSPTAPVQVPTQVQRRLGPEDGGGGSGSGGGCSRGPTYTSCMNRKRNNGGSTGSNSDTTSESQVEDKPVTTSGTSGTTTGTSGNTGNNGGVLVGGKRLNLGSTSFYDRYDNNPRANTKPRMPLGGGTTSDGRGGVLVGGKRLNLGAASYTDPRFDSNNHRTTPRTTSGGGYRSAGARYRQQNRPRARSAGGPRTNRNNNANRLRKKKRRNSEKGFTNGPGPDPNNPNPNAGYGNDHKLKIRKVKPENPDYGPDYTNLRRDKNKKFFGKPKTGDNYLSIDRQNMDPKDVKKKYFPNKPFFPAQPRPAAASSSNHNNNDAKNSNMRESNGKKFLFPGQTVSYGNNEYERPPNMKVQNKNKGFDFPDEDSEKQKVIEKMEQEKKKVNDMTSNAIKTKLVDNEDLKATIQESVNDMLNDAADKAIDSNFPRA